MDLKLFTLTLLLAAALAEVQIGRRQVGCGSDVPNVCNNRRYHAHPNDPSKYLECTVDNHQFVLDCPANEVFNNVTNRCQPRPTLPPTTPQPTTTTTREAEPAPTQAPTGNPTGNDDVPPVVIRNNYAPPCTQAAKAQGLYHFAYDANVHKFIQCDEFGNSWLHTCALMPDGTRLVWNQDVRPGPACDWP